MPTTGHQPFPTAVQWSHHLLEPRLHPGMIAVDATAGNGHDSLFLAQKILPGGQLFIFDVQNAALTSTRQRLLDHHIPLTQIHFHHHGHQHLSTTLPTELRGQISVVMFNLGYLPGGDKSLITLADNSLSAIQQALDWLAPNGIVTVVLYPGHDGGRTEADLIQSYFQTLPTEYFESQKIAFLNYRPTTPFLLTARRKKAHPNT